MKIVFARGKEDCAYAVIKADGRGYGLVDMKGIPQTKQQSLFFVVYR